MFLQEIKSSIVINCLNKDLYPTQSEKLFIDINWVRLYGKRPEIMSYHLKGSSR